MIKIFCDCCKKEIDVSIADYEKMEMEIPVKRVSIEPRSEYGSNEDFLVGFTLRAKIYKPKNLMDNIHEAEHLGWCLCPECIVRTLTYKGR